jgi:hypothetical protein
MQHHSAIPSDIRPAQCSPMFIVTKPAVCACQAKNEGIVGTAAQTACQCCEQGHQSAALLRRQQPEGVGTKVNAVTVLTDEQVAALGDDDLQRYLARVASAMEAAHAVWTDAGCFASKGDRDRLWTAREVADGERFKRPHLAGRSA